jgi:hypothetical protein
MNRSGRGQFSKGKSGNPGGRPKAIASLRSEAQKYTLDMLQVLVKAAKKGSVTAAIAVLDRGYGRPPQSVDIRMLLEKRLTDLTPAELEEFEAHLIAIGADDDEEAQTEH